MKELKTGEFFVWDGVSKQYTIFEYTEFHYEAENVRAEEGLQGLKRYETSDGLKANRLDENSFIVFDGLGEIRVKIKLQIFDDRLT